MILKNPNDGVTDVKDEGNVSYTGAMFVKAVVPVSDVQFDAGKYYNLLINLKGDNLDYADGGWCDKNGNKLIVVGTPNVNPPVVTDPVTPESADPITLHIQELVGWGTATEKEI